MLAIGRAEVTGYGGQIISSGVVSIERPDSQGDRGVLSFLIGGGVLIIDFVIVELRVKDPVMDLRLFRHYSFTMANLLT